MEFGDLDWNSSMYYVYDEKFNTDSAPAYDEVNGNTEPSEIGGNYSEEEQSKVTEAYEHSQIKGNPHETQIGNIPGLSEELQGLRDDIRDAGIYDAANAITGVQGGGATVVDTDEGKKISLEVNTDSAVDIKDGKITLEWEG